MKVIYYSFTLAIVIFLAKEYYKGKYKQDEVDASELL